MMPTVSQSNGPAPSVHRQKRTDLPVDIAPSHVRAISNTATPRFKSTTYGRLAEAILRFALEQGLCPGDRIPPVKELAIIFGVSGPTIRCALTALEVTGHIQKLAGIGSFLIDQSASLRFGAYQESSPLLLLQACLTIEPELAAEAARKCTGGLLTRIRRQEARLRLESKIESDRASTHPEHIHFHELLASVGGKQTAIIIGGLWRAFYAQSNRNAFRCLLTAECQREILSRYKELIDAIGSRDECRAMRAMRGHLIRLQELLRHGSDEENAEIAIAQLLRDVA